ncbi:helix-turn-helix domain-containing protein [Defluviimonas sp. D31]|uniref:helix-turn-helix domain-containing protein n=1 Tax=Defluviimonas sp. D31 TaxID=3083253 RepID=UPI00296F1A23|nr:helix-turn-helix domain-containing protein [Defluviimonas sp. D31]MDW4548400.1 helix-turn-helix domain-containing protein [Defluviimonas sp. D31]
MTKRLPLAKLSLLRPFVAALSERGVDPEIVFERVGLTEAAVLHGDESVHIMVVHQFLEACADAVEDLTFCASVGARLDPKGWPMIETALAAGGSLADFLSTFVSQANEVASSVTTYLEVRGGQATYGETRLFHPTILPAQNDGFMVGLAVTILSSVLGPRFDAGQVSIILCNPDVLPASFSDFKRLKGDEMGFRLKFPSKWLAHSVDHKALGNSVGACNQPENGSNFLTDFRAIIAHKIGQGGLSANDAAALVSMSRATLARRLAKEKTSISDELRRAKIALAKDRLRSSDDSVDEIAAALGYSDRSNFSRAFRAAVGLSPRSFRSQIDANGTDPKT